MYHLHATVTEDLFGVTIHVSAEKHSGRRTQPIEEETWIVWVTAGVDELQHAELERVLDNAVSDLAGKLRRVFPSVSQQEA